MIKIEENCDGQNIHKTPKNLQNRTKSRHIDLTPSSRARYFRGYCRGYGHGYYILHIAVLVKIPVKIPTQIPEKIPAIINAKTPGHGTGSRLTYPDEAHIKVYVVGLHLELWVHVYLCCCPHLPVLCHITPHVDLK